MSYYPIFHLTSDDGVEYTFDTDLDTSRAPTFGLTVRVSRSGEPFATRIWSEMVPMMGIVRSFASAFVRSTKMQERYRNGRDSSPDDTDIDEAGDA